MIRIAILFIFLILAILEYRKPMPPIVFRLAFLGMTLFLALRCGQGTDYFSYSYIYTHGVTDGIEVGYAFLNDLFTALHLPYTVFVFFFSVSTMAVLYFILSKFALNKFMAFFVVYAVYYMQYFENGIRQAIAMLLVIAGFCLTLKKNRIWYLLGAVLLAYTLHNSALIGLVFLIPYLLDRSQTMREFIRRRHTILLILFAALCSVFLWLSLSGGLEKIAGYLPDSLSVRIIGYLKSTTYSIMALFSRVAFLVVIAVLYYCAGEKVTRFERLLMQVYLIGFFLYCVMFTSDLIASRMHAYFKLFEMLLIPNLLFYFDLKNIRRPAFVAQRIVPWLEAHKGIRVLPHVSAVLVPCVLLVFMYCKTTWDVMEQSKYYEPSYWNYPYFSVFSDMQKLDDFRESATYMHVDYYAFVEKANPRLVAVGSDAAKNVFPALKIYSLPEETEDPFDYVFSPDPLSEAGSVINFIGGDKIRLDNENHYAASTVQPESTPTRRIKDIFSSGQSDGG